MNSENYLKFAKFFGAFCFNRKHNPELITSVGNTSDEFINSIRAVLTNSKVFEISDETKKLLALTDPPNKNDEVKLPFPYMFLDVSFTKEELAELGVEIDAQEIVGIAFQEGILIRGEEEVADLSNVLTKPIQNIAGTNLRITTATIQKNNEFWFDTFNKNNNIFGEYKDYKIKVMENPTTDKKARDFVHRFIINFLNFLYDPEVEYVEHVRSEKNKQRRLKEGKMPIPSSFSIMISGRLKQYIDDIASKGHLKYNYSFWVRGYWKTLRSERWGQKRGMRIFVPPFIKGQGVLINKTYVVKQEGEKDEK